MEQPCNICQVWEIGYGDTIYVQPIYSDNGYELKEELLGDQIQVVNILARENPEFEIDLESVEFARLYSTMKI